MIISERQGNENDPGFLLSEALQAAAFQVHPYHHSVIGWQCDLETMTREQLYGHYRTFYAPNNAIVAVAGDFESDAMLARIDELFGGIPAGPALPPFTAKEPPQRGERRVTVEGPGTTAYLEIGYRAPCGRPIPTSTRWSCSTRSWAAPRGCRCGAAARPTAARASTRRWSRPSWRPTSTARSAPPSTRISSASRPRCARVTPWRRSSRPCWPRSSG